MSVGIQNSALQYNYTFVQKYGEGQYIVDTPVYHFLNGYIGHLLFQYCPLGRVYLPVFQVFALGSIWQIIALRECTVKYCRPSWEARETNTENQLFQYHPTPDILKFDFLAQ